MLSVGIFWETQRAPFNEDQQCFSSTNKVKINDLANRSVIEVVVRTRICNIRCKQVTEQITE